MEKESGKREGGVVTSTFSFESSSCPRDFAQQRKVCEAVAGALGGKLLGYVIEDTGEAFLHTITATGEDAESIAGYCGAMAWAETMWEQEDGYSVEGRWEGMDNYPEEEEINPLPQAVEAVIEEAFLSLKTPTTKH